MTKDFYVSWHAMRDLRRIATFGLTLARRSGMWGSVLEYYLRLANAQYFDTTI